DSSFFPRKERTVKKKKYVENQQGARSIGGMLFEKGSADDFAAFVVCDWICRAWLVMHRWRSRRKLVGGQRFLSRLCQSTSLTESLDPLGQLDQAAPAQFIQTRIEQISIQVRLAGVVDRVKRLR